MSEDKDGEGERDTQGDGVPGRDGLEGNGFCPEWCNVADV